MSQCVPNWDLDDNSPPARRSGRSNSSLAPSDVPILDYEVAELTWENGQPAMHGYGQPRVSLKPMPQQPVGAANSKYAWEKLPRSGPGTGAGTLESIVNQAATALPHSSKQPLPLPPFEDLVPWFDNPGGAATSATMTMDALVPCAADPNNIRKHNEQGIAGGAGPLFNESSSVPPTCVVGSCSGTAAANVIQEEARKRARVAAAVRVPVAGEWSGRDQYSMSESATMGRDSQQMTVEKTADREMCFGFTSTSMGSQDNTSSGALPCTQATATATADEHDSVCHSRSQREAGDDEEDKVKRDGKSSVSTKRSRAAAIHNQSERKRRDKINQRMKTLQKLVPNSSKTDKASVLDEVIEYLKQLQAQVQMMSRMNMPHMMLPMAMQQQLQMSMMAPMAGLGMGMGMGMPGVMDMSSLAGARAPNLPGMPPNASTPILHPVAANPFMPLAASWDGSGCNGDRLHPASAAAAALPDPLAAFLACQSQSMTVDAYSRMAAIYQQLHQPPASSSKN